MRLPRSANSNNSKVLIIDDEADLCLLMRAYYVRQNCTVFICHTAADGIRKAAEEQPAYILASRNLSGGAYRLEQKLREAAPMAAIILTGNSG